MEETIQKYIHYRNKISEYTKHMDELKKQIKAQLKETTTNMNYEKNGYEANIRTMYKTTINKKDVPTDVWEKYSVTTQYEILNVKKK